MVSTDLQNRTLQVKDVKFVPVKHIQRIQAAAALISGENTTGLVLSDEAAWSLVVDLLLTRPGDFDSNPQLQALLRDPVRLLESSLRIFVDARSYLCLSVGVAGLHVYFVDKDRKGRVPCHAR